MKKDDIIVDRWPIGLPIEFYEKRGYNIKPKLPDAVIEFQLQNDFVINFIIAGIGFFQNISRRIFQNV